MTMKSHESAARDLAERRRTGRLGPALAVDERPANVDEAIALQRELVRLSGDTIGGWKCALPTPARTIVGPLLSATIRSASPYPVHLRGTMASIEPEIAFVMARDLPPRATPHSPAEIRGAIGEVRLVLEILGNRFAVPEQVTPLELLADCSNNQGLFKGPVVAGGLERPLAQIALEIRGPQGALSRIDGRHPDGDPLRPLGWFVDFLNRRDETLYAGQIVTTGSYAGAVDAPIDTPLSIRFGDLGTIDVRFVAAP